jgi:hypothetical protein
MYVRGTFIPQNFTVTHFISLHFKIKSLHINHVSDWWIGERCLYIANFCMCFLAILRFQRPVLRRRFGRRAKFFPDLALFLLRDFIKRGVSQGSNCLIIARAVPRNVGAPGRLMGILWHPSKPIYLKIFGRAHAWRIIFMGGAHIANKFRRNSFACGNLRLLSTYLRLFQWRLSAPYRLTLRAAARLATCFNRTDSTSIALEPQIQVRRLYCLNLIIMVHRVIIINREFYLYFNNFLIFNPIHFTEILINCSVWVWNLVAHIEGGT